MDVKFKLTKTTKVSSKQIQKGVQEHLQKEAPRIIKKAITDEIKRASFRKTPTRLIKSFEVNVDKDRVEVTSDHPASEYLNRGVARYQMRHLTKSSSPIPIIKDTGEVIFRAASSKTMRDGKWYHPGIKGKHFLDKGIKRGKEALKEEAVKAFKQEFLKRFKG